VPHPKRVFCLKDSLIELNRKTVMDYRFPTCIPLSLLLCCKLIWLSTARNCSPLPEVLLLLMSKLQQPEHRATCAEELDHLRVVLNQPRVGKKAHQRIPSFLYGRSGNHDLSSCFVSFPWMIKLHWTTVSSSLLSDSFTF
jgi:hypothetical protein